jgi:diaminohydroxyphosphoribosylaminopyrimidine deaminase/5-amino-6-(5-phosphoribosylamino)uracil reductase
MTDADHMRRAIALARAQLGRTGGNPAVGCVIVRDGIVIGEGATADGGRPHAEELALDGVHEGARGATAFVTLEPCAVRSSGGSSCSERLVAAGVARVVFACADLSVFAAGQGAQKLISAGINVDQGLIEFEARTLYVDYVPAKTIESRR